MGAEMTQTLRRELRIKFEEVLHRGALWSQDKLADALADAALEVRGIALAGIVQAANKTMDAVISDAVKAESVKVNYPNRGALPDANRELIDAWVLASGIKPINREASGWLAESQNWLNLGATGDDIKAAWEYAKANYPAPPSSPFGLTNTLRNLKAGNLKIKDEAKLQAPPKDGKGFYA